MSKITRKQAEAHVKAKRPVKHQGRVIEREKDLPHEGAPGDYVALRHDDGHFTRAGLEHILQSGGSVLHGGAVIDKVEDLPSEEDLAAHDVSKLASVVDSIDEQTAKLHQQRVHAQERLAKAEQLKKEMVQQGQKEMVVASGQGGSEAAAEQAKAAHAQQPQQAPKAEQPKAEPQQSHGQRRVHKE